MKPSTLIIYHSVKLFLHRLFGVGVAGARDYIHVYKGPREEKAPLNQCLTYHIIEIFVVKSSDIMAKESG